MLLLLRSIWALLLGILILMLGHGLQGTLLGVRANLEQFPTAVTGIVMSGYYIGMLLGSLRAPAMVARVGHVRVFGALLSVASAAVLIFPLVVEPITWFTMRLVTGFCMSGIFIVAESWLNGSASNTNRGSLLSVYMVVQMGGMAVGQFMLNLADPGDYPLFILISALASVAAVPMLLTASAAPNVTASRRVGLLQLYRLSPLGVVGILGVGLAHSGLFAMGPVYAQDVGMPLVAISAFMAGVILGGTLFQWPIGQISDRHDRRWVIAIVALCTALVAMPPLLMGNLPPLALFPGFFLVGGLSLPLYALCVAHTNDFLSPEQTVGASSALLLGYGIGAAAGPTAAATLMQAGGPGGYPLYLALVHGTVGLFAVWRMTRRPTVPLEARGPYIVLPQQPTPVSASLAQEHSASQTEAAPAR